MKNISIILTGIIAVSISVCSFPVLAAEEEPAKATKEDKTEKSKDKKSDKGKDNKKKKDKSLKDFVKDMEKTEGLFTFYRDKKKGDLYMELRSDQLDAEYIYFTYVRNGVVGAPGLRFRGQIGNNQIISFSKYYDRIEIISEITNYYYNPDSPLKRSEKANMSTALLASLDIKATAEDKKSFVIPADKIFLGDAMVRLTPRERPTPTPKSKSSGPGKFSRSKSKITEVNGYPENSDVIVDYVFDGSNKKGKTGLPRNGTMTLQHSFIKMPDDGYQPRRDDPRVGYFFQRVTDLTSHSVTPYRDMIDRWRLVKKDPTAEISAPVKPIIFWLENTTPHEYRDTIRDALLQWNIAFEKAGFKDAIQVKIQPDDATWDAGDIRYNVLRWTASSKPPFGGYGPHFSNPRTGEILGADIMLEHSFVTNRLRDSSIFATAGFEDIIAADNMDSSQAEDPFLCSMGHELHMSSLFGQAVLAAADAPDVDRNELVKQGLYYLTLHEVGHTLGLNHNMKASQLHDFKDLHNKEITGKIGLVGSVMDYPAVNIARQGEKQGYFYTMRPGPYDIWAIEFGYSPDMEDMSARDKLLARSTEPALTFGNDADDMRSTSSGIDPRTMISDMSSDAITFAEHQMTLASETIDGMLEKYSKSDQSWHEFRSAFLKLSSMKVRAGGVISRYIGGVYVDRAFVGQETGADAPFTPVPYELQKRAMATLSAQIFAPDAFGYSADVIRHLQQQRRGFDFSRKPEDPKIHDRVARFHKSILSALTSDNMLKRLTDTGLYGNRYSVSEMMGDLTNAIFEADLKSDVNSFRQNLQMSYVKKLISLTNGHTKSNQTKAAAFANLNEIQAWMKKSRRGNSETRAHRKYLGYVIEQALYSERG